MKETTKKRICDWIWEKSCRLFKHSQTFQPYIVEKREVKLIRWEAVYAANVYDNLSAEDIMSIVSYELGKKLWMEGFVDFESQKDYMMDKIKVKAQIKIIQP